MAAILAIGSILKRDDCASELTSVLFRDDAAGAEWLMSHMLRLLALPAAAKRKGEEPLMVQEFALLTGGAQGHWRCVA